MPTAPGRIALRSIPDIRRSIRYSKLCTVILLPVTRQPLSAIMSVGRVGSGGVISSLGHPVHTSSMSEKLYEMGIAGLKLVLISSLGADTSAD